MCDIKISIVVPVYNAGKYLHQCIESLLAQTYRKLEIILVDDGSKDDSLMICKQYEGTSDITVRVVHQENSGSSMARKNGAMYARGDYVGFIDADDYIVPNMYENMMTQAQEHSADVVVCGIAYLRNGNILPSYSKLIPGVYRHEKLQQLLDYAVMDGARSPDSVIPPSLCNKIIRKDLLQKHMDDIQIRLAMGDDWVVAYPCLWDAETVVIMNECYYIYRYNEEGITKSYNPHMWKNIEELYNIATYINKKYNYQKDSYLRFYFQYMIILCVVNEMRSEENRSFPVIRKKVKEKLNSEVKRYAFQSKLVKFQSRRAKMIAILVKYRLHTMLSVLISIKVERKKL